MNVYGAMQALDLHHGIGGETYFRLARDWSRADSAADFYLGFARIPCRGVELCLGRQVLADVPGAICVADAGKVCIDHGGPWACSLYGGQPRYVVPGCGPALVSQDEQVFGASLQWRRLPGGSLTLSALQLERSGHRVSQLTGAHWYQTLRVLPWRPPLYGLVAYDTAEQNVQQAVAGLHSPCGAHCFCRWNLHTKSRAPAPLMDFAASTDLPTRCSRFFRRAVCAWLVVGCTTSGGLTCLRTPITRSRHSRSFPVVRWTRIAETWGCSGFRKGTAWSWCAGSSPSPKVAAAGSTPCAPTTKTARMHASCSGQKSKWPGSRKSPTSRCGGQWPSWNR